MGCFKSTVLVGFSIVVNMFGIRVVEHIPASIDEDAFIILLCITSNIMVMGFVMSSTRATANDQRAAVVHPRLFA